MQARLSNETKELLLLALEALAELGHHTLADIRGMQMVVVVVVVVVVGIVDPDILVVVVGGGGGHTY